MQETTETPLPRLPELLTSSLLTLRSLALFLLSLLSDPPTPTLWSPCPSFPIIASLFACWLGLVVHELLRRRAWRLVFWFGLQLNLQLQFWSVEQLHAGLEGREWSLCWLREGLFDVIVLIRGKGEWGEIFFEVQSGVLRGLGVCTEGCLWWLLFCVCVCECDLFSFCDLICLNGRAKREVRGLNCGVKIEWAAVSGEGVELWSLEQLVERYLNDRCVDWGRSTSRCSRSVRERGRLLD